MKILLAAINAKYIHSNLAVYCLKAYAKMHCQSEYGNGEIEIEIGEYTINQQIDDIMRDVYERQPDVLCLSCYIWNLKYVEELIREMKKVRPDLIIWTGGPEVSYDAPEVLKRLPEVAGVMKGEGEKTFCEVSMAYLQAEKENGNLKVSDERFSEIDGITYRDSEGMIKENAWREPMDLSEVPFVYDQLEDFEHKIIYYETSRGCPFSCSYCLSSIDKRLRFRGLDLVFKELQFFLDHKVPQVKFVDRTFNCKHDHAKAIWQYISEHDNGITNFHFEVSADLLNEEELNIITGMRPGLIQLEIGVQSTNADTIREIHRTMNLEELAKKVDRVNRAGNIHQHLDLIAGLPFEDLKSFAKSFDDVYRMRPEQLQLGFLKVLKGSYMESKKENYGLQYKSLPPYEVLSTKWISYEEILHLKGIEEMVEVYYNSRQFEETIEALEKEYESAFSMFEKMWEFYKHEQYHQVNHKRSERYEILLRFVAEYHPDQVEYFRELLTYDYYLRENAKSRPSFAGEEVLTKEEFRQFYETEDKERRYLKSYEKYDKNQLRKMTHLEKFPLLQKTVLFDYLERNPLTQDARICVVDCTENHCKG
ncbi:MAG: B12-binding domain-containing radical SAM protein [Lachnospiraceae bacterium]|nr:B12-binding domain-containing radical SAM protein [Lachnospiraceae bacterium]